MITRRTVLSGAAAAGIGFVSARASAQTLPPLAVVIQLSTGARYVYDVANGSDLGDFASTIGGFTQRCIRVDHPGFPLSVFFRPDRSSSRVEVVFELGRVLGGSLPTTLPAYTATITAGDQTLATVQVPVHYWYSRWRWQSSPRPIVGNVNQLISQGLLPPYDTVGGISATSVTQKCLPSSSPFKKAAPCFAVNTTTFVPSPTLPALMTGYKPYTVMGTSDITPYMPRTGERPDIGLVTEPQAQFICTGSPVALGALRAWAEGAGTVPWHIRDEVTGAPLNLLTYPNASWYWDQRVGAPWIPLGDNPVTIDTAHAPALGYVPYMLTGDPYHLEDMQFAANWDRGALPPKYRPSIGQSRSFAWSIRNLAQCARVTPETVPTWLLPRNYWLGFLSESRAFLEANYANNPSPVMAMFRSTSDINSGRDEGVSAPGGTWIDPWQDEFVATVIGWVIRMGFNDWQTAFDWKLGTTIARTGNTSGWCRAYATPYRVILRSALTAPLVSTWSEAWALTKQVRGIPTVTDPDTWVDPDMTYLAYTRGVLAMGQSLERPGTANGLEWSTQQLRSKGWKTAYKWRLGSGL